MKIINNKIFILVALIILIILANAFFVSAVITNQYIESSSDDRTVSSSAGTGFWKMSVDYDFKFDNNTGWSGTGTRSVSSSSIRPEGTCSSLDKRTYTCNSNTCSFHEVNTDSCYLDSNWEVAGTFSGDYLGDLFKPVIDMNDHYGEDYNESYTNRVEGPSGILCSGKDFSETNPCRKHRFWGVDNKRCIDETSGTSETYNSFFSVTSGFCCDTNDDGKEDNLDFVCDYNADVPEKDACYNLDSDGDTFNQECCPASLGDEKNKTVYIGELVDDANGQKICNATAKQKCVKCTAATQIADCSTGKNCCNGECINPAQKVCCGLTGANGADCRELKSRAEWPVEVGGNCYKSGCGDINEKTIPIESFIPEDWMDLGIKDSINKFIGINKKLSCSDISVSGKEIDNGVVEDKPYTISGNLLSTCSNLNGVLIFNLEGTSGNSLRLGFATIYKTLVTSATSPGTTTPGTTTPGQTITTPGYFYIRRVQTIGRNGKPIIREQLVWQEGTSTYIPGTTTPGTTTPGTTTFTKKYKQKKIPTIGVGLKDVAGIKGCNVNLDFGLTEQYYSIGSGYKLRKDTQLEGVFSGDGTWGLQISIGAHFSPLPGDYDPFRER